MEKQTAPKAATDPAKKPAAQNTGAPNQARTENLTMSNEEDDAADVLLDRDESVAADESAGSVPEAGGATSSPAATEALLLKKVTSKPVAGTPAATRPEPAAQPASAGPAAKPPAAPAPAAQKTLGD